MNKEQIYKYLKERNIPFEITEHKAVFNMHELNDVYLPYPEWDGKNLFIRDDKKRNYYLLTVRGNKTVNLKDFRHKNNLRPLSFASSEDLLSILKLTPGSVTPLGLLNDENQSVKFFIDEEFRNNRIGVHPNDNTATIWLNTDDLINIIKEHGNEVEYTSF
ncbi:MAG: prolyl-tRNA synthetase associated domain-containing protein [Erysipelotrichaceae bacterium]